MTARKRVNMTFLEHLAELRSRLLRALMAIAAASIAAFVFADKIFYFLTLPAGGSGINLVYIDLTEMLSIYMKVCLSAGIALAMPYLAYQALMFIFPALNKAEKRNMLLLLPVVALAFIGGGAFGYFVLLPPAIKFLLTFGADIATPQIRIGSYVTVATRVILATGIIFELPVISSFLAKIGVVSYSWLAGKRKHAIVLSFILGAILTPTLDPINQCLIALPLIVLYEVSILLARVLQKKESAVTIPSGVLQDM